MAERGAVEGRSGRGEAAMLASVFFGSGEAGMCASSAAILGVSLAAAEHKARTWVSGVAILGGVMATAVNKVEHGFPFPLAES